MDGEVIRKLLIGVGFKVDDKPLDQAEKRTERTKHHADGLEKAFMRAAAAIAAFGAASKSIEAIKANLDLEKQLGKIQTLVPDNIAQVQNYRDELLDMSQRTGRSLKDLAGATYEVGSAFGVTADTIKLTEISSKAATAAGAETTEAVNLLSAVTLAYGDTSVKAAQNVADLAAMAANIGKTSLPEMAAKIGEVTGASVQLGVKQQELFAIIGTAAGVTGTTAMMMTQLKATMTNLAAPTKDLQRAYKKLGITNIETEVAQRGLVPTLQKIIATTDGSVKATAKLFSSDEARALILPLVTKLNGRYAETLKQLTHAQGSAQQAYDASTKGLAQNAHAAELAEAKFDAMQVQVGQKLAPAYLQLLGLTSDLTEALLGEDVAQQGVIDRFKDHLETLRAFKEVVLQTLKILSIPLITVLKVVDQVMLAMKAVKTFKDDPTFDNALGITDHLGMAALHGSPIGLVLETVNQTYGLEGAVPGYDSRGMGGAFRDMGVREANKGVTNTLGWYRDQAASITAHFGDIKIALPAGTTEEQGTKVVDVVRSEMAKGLRRMAETHKGPKAKGASEWQ